MDKYTCEQCKGTFKRINSDALALKEFRDNFPKEAEIATIEDLAIVCEDCYVEINKWVESLSEDESNKIMKDYYGDRI